MIKKIKDCTKDEILDYLEKNDSICKYCNYDDVEGPCKGVACYGGEPIYPYCADEPKVYDEIVENFKQHCYENEIEEI